MFCILLYTYIGKPGLPGNFQKVSSTCSTVKLKWINPNPPGYKEGDIILGRLTIVPHPNGGLCQTGECSSTNTITITHLHYSEMYKVGVVICSCVGCGNASTLDILLNSTNESKHVKNYEVVH